MELEIAFKNLIENQLKHTKQFLSDSVYLDKKAIILWSDILFFQRCLYPLMDISKYYDSVLSTLGSLDLDASDLIELLEEIDEKGFERLIPPLFNKLSQCLVKEESYDGYADSLSYLAQGHLIIGDTDIAWQKLQETLEVVDNIENEAYREAILERIIGLIALYGGRTHNLEALKLSKKLAEDFIIEFEEVPEAIKIICQQWVHLALQTNDNKQLEEVLKFIWNIKDESYRLLAFTEMVKELTNTPDKSLAEKMLSDILGLAEEITNPELKTNVFREVVHTLIALGNKKKAIKILEKTIQIAQSILIPYCRAIELCRLTSEALSINQIELANGIENLIDETYYRLGILQEIAGKLNELGEGEKAYSVINQVIELAKEIKGQANRTWAIRAIAEKVGAIGCLQCNPKLLKQAQQLADTIEDTVQRLGTKLTIIEKLIYQGSYTYTAPMIKDVLLLTEQPEYEEHYIWIFTEIAYNLIYTSYYKGANRFLGIAREYISKLPLEEQFNWHKEITKRIIELAEHFLEKENFQTRVEEISFASTPSEIYKCLDSPWWKQLVHQDAKLTEEIIIFILQNNIGDRRRQTVEALKTLMRSQSENVARLIQEGFTEEKSLDFLKTGVWLELQKVSPHLLEWLEILSVLISKRFITNYPEAVRTLLEKIAPEKISLIEEFVE